MFQPCPAAWSTPSFHASQVSFGSRVRPVDAAGVAAGPNALRGSGPKQSRALSKKCVDPNGLCRSPERPYLHYVVMPSPIGVAALPKWVVGDMSDLPLCVPKTQTHS